MITGQPWARIIQAGVGVRGSTWARIIQEEPAAILAALVDPRFPDLKSELGGLADGVPCFRDLAAALDAVQADAVLLATPPEGHHRRMGQEQQRVGYPTGRALGVQRALQLHGLRIGDLSPPEDPHPP